MTSFIKRQTYYKQYVKKDGSLTSKKKIYESMFVKQITMKGNRFYIVTSKSEDYQTGETVYTLERHKKSKTSIYPDNYVRYQRKDGSYTKAKPFKDYLQLGKVHKRFGMIPYIVTMKSELGYRSNLYTLERY
ncbi:hypothetical protein [Exiguobacterium sp. s133]|uniref:hypothetical protein n=1 Tax=Exiguobacterium sp. s133 TaxID=2751213 RepID=UPI001BE73293|nr:hypothetical protein [Exiguobacterium sp. s133]